MSTDFADLDLRPELTDELASLGYEEATPIQAEAIPVLLAGKDLLGQAATGTGKTAAFALPILNRLGAQPRGNDPVALILTPTRELAMQVSEAVHRYGKALGARVLPVYGGQPIGRQLRELQRGVDVVVATPGRALDHLSRGTLRLSACEIVVLDEADEMLDMGFTDDIEAILEQAPVERQTVLFSATIPAHIERIARKHLTDPVRIQIAREITVEGTSPKVKQTAYLVARAHKPAALGRLLDLEQPEAAIVFCRTREEVDTLTATLNGRGYRAEPLHGGMGQEQRDRVMGRLRGRTADLLVATDVAARGLDVDHLTHVINYNVPSAPESYVHRIGRVGRAGREGVAITLAEPRETRMLKQIERLTKQRVIVEKVPTVEDLQRRRLEQTKDALREVLIDADSDPATTDRFRSVVESLSDDFDVMDVALAAVRLAHESLGVEIDESEIPEPTIRPDRPDSGGTGAKKPWQKTAPSGAPSSGSARPAGKGGKQMIVGTKVFVGLGKAAGVRPQDLVGAIAGESSLKGRDIGGIQITERFSLVEVPDDRVEEVITALRGTLIKGRKATVRREKF